MPGGAAESRRRIALNDEAIDWLVHLRSGRATAAEQAAFAAWRRRSAAHEAAACDAEALWHDFGETRTAKAYEGRDATDGASQAGNAEDKVAVLKHGRSRQIRRRIIAGSIAASLVVAVAISGIFGPTAGLYADHATQPGELQEVRLPDGSTAILNTATALSVISSADSERRLVLHEGEALFDVGTDEARPFIVAAGEGEVTVLGTVFAVRRDSHKVSVVVLEGRVQLRASTSPDRPITLEAGQQSGFDGQGVDQPVPVDADKATAWARGKLIFNQRPLADVVAELERYRSGRIFVADSRLEELRVTGVFDLKDTDGALRGLESTLGVTVLRLPFFTVIH